MFDPLVATFEVDPCVGPFPELYPEERAGLDRAREDRLLEFQAGRHCARMAMDRLGLPPRAIVRGEDRAPVWPEGLVGSITHTRRGGRGFCAAAVARSAAIRALGVDAELDVPLDEGLFARVLTADEVRRLAAHGGEARGRTAKLVFSVKECVYKCQHPLSQKFLAFGDVEVEIPVGADLDPLAPTGEFSARLLVEALPFREGHLFRGRFVRREGVIVTGLTLGPGG